ncbi:hypothetical protein LCGC14_0869440 [marine sediment metagenome]|uniref:Uncharacterized protein n=1 Tax=marine sediment metagenome TaxID=412755 RepID=A0A0F9SC35_9ZZZZ
MGIMKIRESGVINVLMGILLNNVRITEGNSKARINSHRNKINWISLVHNDHENGEKRISIHGVEDWDEFMRVINEVNVKVLYIRRSKVEDYPTDKEVMSNI